jgi:cell division protein FtsL
MPEETGRFEWVTRVARLAFVGTVALLIIALIASVAMVAMTLPGPVGISTGGADSGSMSYVQVGQFGKSESMLWVVLVTAEMVALMWSIVMYGLIRSLAAWRGATTSLGSRIDRVETLMDEASRGIRELAELAPLSDRAKRLLHRDREVEALREAIHEDIIRQDYARAEDLAKTVETELGYVAEAAELRAEIAKSRDATVEEKIDLAIARIDELCNDRKWARALREAQRVLRLFPDNPKVASLPDRIMEARNSIKRRLLQSYGEAVRKNDVDSGVKLLQELDTYLTPQEGAALQESARGVFKARLHNLGVQFAICVTDQRWQDAITAGQAIIAEFPNSRFAQEVREKMQLLRSRVQQSQAAD